MSDPMKNKDRVDDEKHRRRREVGEDEDTPDGRAVADRLYGGFTDSNTDSQDDGTQ